MSNQRHPGPAVGDGSFDAFYYANCCGKPYLRNEEWLAIFGGFADRIVRDIAPKKVLDAGCALGLLVECLRDRDVDAFGIDLSSYAISQLHDRVRPYCRQGSIAADFGDDYDLIVCIEVVEHMPAAEAEAAIENFCRHTDDVLFSSSPVDYREPTHVNVHPPEHWAELFARHGFYRDVDFDASFITAWAARFRRLHEPVHRVIRGYERRHWELLKAAHDARGFGSDLQAELARTRDALERAGADVVALGDQLAEQRLHLEGTAEALQQTQLALGQARDRVSHMERSAFWRVRALWVGLKRHLGWPED